MTREEFVEWKTSLATQEVFDSIKSKVGRMEYALARVAGDDPKEDLLKRGYILALEDVLNIEFEETEND